MGDVSNASQTSMSKTYCVIRIELKGHPAFSKEEAEALANKNNKRLQKRPWAPENPTIYKTVSTKKGIQLLG